jgi:hypothetical protein
LQLIDNVGAVAAFTASGFLFHYSFMIANDDQKVNLITHFREKTC